MRNAIGLAFAIAAAALVGVDNYSGLAQEQAKMKLAPPQVFQPPFPYSLGIVAQGKRTIYVAGQVALNDKGELVGKDDPEALPASTAFIAPLLNPDWLVEVEAVAVVD